MKFLIFENFKLLLLWEGLKFKTQKKIKTRTVGVMNSFSANNGLPSNYFFIYSGAFGISQFQTQMINLFGTDAF